MLLKYKISFNLNSIAELNKSILLDLDILLNDINFEFIPKKFLTSEYFGILSISKNNKIFFSIFNNNNKNRICELIELYIKLLNQFKLDKMDHQIFSEELESIYTSITTFEKYKCDIKDLKIFKSFSIKPVSLIF